MNLHRNFILSLIFLFSFSHFIQAQVIFQENFSNGLPQNVALVNQDNLSPDPSVNNFIDAWIVRPDFDGVNFVAASTSWYSPPGQSDDWMILPQFALGNHTVLTWRARALDTDFPDGYEVLIATSDTQLASFSNVAFSISEENNFWTTRSISLSDLGFANQSVFIAFRNHSTDKFILFIDDILLRNVADDDVALLDVILPESSCGLSANESLSVRITNNGLNAINNFSLNFTLNGTPFSNEVFSGTLNPNDTIVYTFQQSLDMSIPDAAYSVQVFATLINDADNTNNQSSATTFHIQPIDALANAYHTSFEDETERLGWKILDNNQDNTSWRAFEGNSETGNYAFLYFFNETNAADDWLFSTCFDLIANQPYRLSFKHRVGQSQGTVYPEKLLLSYGNAATPNAMTDTVVDFGEINNIVFQNNTFSIVPQSSGTFFFGFKAYSDANQFFIALDDFTLEELLAPSASFTFTTDGLIASFTSAQAADNVNELFWDFGDDSTSNSRSPEHIYAQPGTYQVCLTVTNASGFSQFCDSVSVDFQVVGVQELNPQIFNLFPNPAHEQLHIFLKEQNATEMTVRDVWGRTLFKNKLSKNETVLDISAWADGIYWIEMKQKESLFIRKFIKISAP